MAAFWIDDNGSFIDCPDDDPRDIAHFMLGGDSLLAIRNALERGWVMGTVIDGECRLIWSKHLARPTLRTLIYRVQRIDCRQFTLDAPNLKTFVPRDSREGLIGLLRIAEERASKAALQARGPAFGDPPKTG